MSRTCQVRMYKGPCDCKVSCSKCQIGCYNPARHRNPFFGKEFADDKYWWRGCYGYAEFLCAACYDHMVESTREWEEVYSEEEGYVEDPEFTKLLETL